VYSKNIRNNKQKTSNMNKEKQPQMNIDIKQSTPIKDDNGNQVFFEATVLRKMSKFLTGTSEDAVIPIPVFVNKDGKILIELLPKELREEYEEYNKTA
jgi:hypothetical protein